MAALSPQVRAANIYGRVPVECADDIDAMIREAVSYVGQGEYSMAESILLDVLNEDRSNQRALKLLVNCYLKLGQYQNALDMANRMLNYASDDEWAREKRAYCEAVLDGRIKSEQQISEERQKEEDDAYKAACDRGSADAMREFMRNYPLSNHGSDARRRLEDIDMWESTKSIGTISAYREYLSRTKAHLYDGEANAVIEQMMCDEAWNKARSVGQIEALNDFRAKYPNSKYDNDAKYLIYTMTAEDCFARKDYHNAVANYKSANDIQAISGEILHNHWTTAEDMALYEDVLASEDVDFVKGYLSKLQMDNVRFAPVSNHLAIIMAKRFTRTSSREYRKEVMTYALDKETRRRAVTIMEEMRRK